MASVPSAGCLLAARNQYYRTRVHSTSDGTSSGLCRLENAMEHEKPHQGFLFALEKCLWLKNFLNCEPAHHPVNTGLSTGSGHR
ncbi:pancreatic progenitor cell differentiation and proliferation factor-like protein [Hemiscyllium ocellatum]|uniref:pancreatic progenitor cell differentiation and proliferation factor-like protein n=1 Tax=Hemiscyllium ocellatum TaxID=170820 RepID=UPI00296712A5|nr:pancreatic progenitor cell differentiation and proliferation factor-like protein [Hemiscyllium ocellatum]